MKTRLQAAAVLFRFALTLIIAVTATMAIAGITVSFSFDPDEPITATTSLSSYNPALSPRSIDLSSFLGADRFYNDGITGQNTITANVEGGHIWNSHETLTHVSLYTPAGLSASFDGHPTMIGLMVGGRTDNVISGEPATMCTGLAYGTDLRSGAFASELNDDGSFSFYLDDFVDVYDHFFGNADVINSSYGSTDSTANSGVTFILDSEDFQNPTTAMVCAAGNDGPSSNTVNGPASGYNTISVGAIGNSNNYDTIASFSSRGLSSFYNPATGVTTPNCRATVDICAPGVDIYGAYYDSDSPNTADYGYGDGTSFAAPIVAAGISVLKSASKTKGLPSTSLDTRVVKAVLLNSADKFASWNNAQTTTVEGYIKTTQSLDATYGAGMMNLDKAYDQLLSGTTDVDGLGGGTIKEIGWDYGSLDTVGSSNNYMFETSLQGGTAVTVTLSWFSDREVTSINYDTGSISGTTALADLDLAIYDENDNLIATSVSDYNTVEHLYFELDETGTYYISVIFDQMTYGSLYDVSYGLAWSATAVPEPGQLIMLLSLAVSMLVWRRVQR